MADTTDPTVVLTNPTNLQMSVAPNQTIAATFSKSIAPLTVAANFAVTGQGGAAVAGSVNYDSPSKTATFTPSTMLAANTTFTATIKSGANGIKDLSGNPLANDVVWTFTTGATADTTPPTVVSTNPANLKTNVALNKAIAATFSESIKPQSIAANFTVTGPGNTAVVGTVSYDTLSDTATFTPSSQFFRFQRHVHRQNCRRHERRKGPGRQCTGERQRVELYNRNADWQAPINLGAASTFAIMATASISGTGPTQINGDIGLNPGMRPGNPAVRGEWDNPY